MRNKKNQINPDFPCCQTSTDLLIDKALRELTSRHRVLSAGNIVTLVEVQYGREAADKVMARLTEAPQPAVAAGYEDATIARAGELALSRLGRSLASLLSLDPEVEVESRLLKKAAVELYGEEVAAGVMLLIVSKPNINKEGIC